MLLGMPQQLAQGTSLAVILVTSPVGTIENLRLGNVLVRLLAMLAVGAAIGGALASLVVQNVPRDLLARSFGVFQIVSAALTWRAAAKMKRPTAAPSRA